MDFIENAAGKYMKGSGGGGGAGGGDGDVDWSHLSGLASQFGKADNETDGDLDASTFKSFLGGFGGGGGSGGIAAATSAAANQANLNAPPGYPGSGGAAPNTNVIDKLLGQYQQHTGEPFKGEESQYSKLTDLAQKLTGQNIPLPILKKMVSWKLKGLM